MIIIIFDKFFSILGLIILMPLFILVIPILKFTGEGEIFFFQDRAGLNRKNFKLIKFATMLKNSPASGTVTIKNDPRILPFGKFLRFLKINELPQLFNVLKGDLSLVGPRPQVDKSLDDLPKELRNKLSMIKPGLSGLASVILRDEEKVLSKVENPVEFHRTVLTPFKANLEIWFNDRRSLKNYFVLIFLTIFAIIFPRFKLYNSFFKSRPIGPKVLEQILS